MLGSIERIDVHLDGIGHLISDRKIEVPAYQRSFAWEIDQITDLLRDISDAIRANSPEYFLGTIVLTPAENDKVHVIDGQQRIASTLIFIAQVRNYLRARGDAERAETIQAEYIARRDRRTLETHANVVLNESDNPFFQGAIIEDTITAPSTEAHKRIADAKKIAGEFVQRITDQSHEPIEALNDWLDFIDNKAKVIVVNVSSKANAYTIFEVLNDRGIDLSIADLLKNYLFRISETRLGEVQDAWTSMRSRIESVDNEKEIKTFIRHVWSSKYGLTRERELYDRIKERVTGRQQAVDFSVELNNSAADYVALQNPGNPKWRALGSATQDAIYALAELRVTQSRPLILAILRKFTDAEIRRALPMLVSWTVRFLIGGSGGSGTLENLFSSTAEKVSTEEIATARQLYEATRATLPTDATFREAFSNASVAKNYLARFYLRSIASHDNPEGEYRISQHHDDVNLEHILPQNPGENWSNISAEDATNWYKRLGNLTIMDSALNVAAANASFDEKKKIYAQSQIEITRSLSEVKEWTLDAIQVRQNELADKAVKLWKLTP
ncbi:DUF262 domain-containing protein [Paracoccus aerius]|uniref:DUF262 domain-containing protein n=1 Tax=Paracoccus aerius TaxID=1915382 RepID=A0ABS1S4K5_9RHOB|nr:DUF262 domain-containing protein [Paracoccus aerius]MBL3673647.1 DUF262 domain-containing protein [Paracoccus aerius]GHG22417.1 hypothetical protein GCM10017322_19960 [Paracoccus aerius]